MCYALDMVITYSQPLETAMAALIRIEFQTRDGEWTRLTCGVEERLVPQVFAALWARGDVIAVERV